MKINYALHSCDSNPFYADFWPIVSKAWLKLGITPVLIKIGSEDVFISRETIEIEVKNVDGVPIAYQALNARIWGYKMLQGNCVISDIDMMPLSKAYFDKISEPYSDEYIISSASDAKEKWGQIASCYFVANTKVIANLIAESTWQEFIVNRSNETGAGWGGDQWYLEELIKKHDKVIHLRRGFNEAGQADKRIDRDNWRYLAEDVKKGAYYDAHLLRPYGNNKKEIDYLYSLI